MERSIKRQGKNLHPSTKVIRSILVLVNSEAVMKIVKICLASLLLVTIAYAMPLNSSARAGVPGDLLPIISGDYPALKDSSPAMALKQQGFPGYLKEVGAPPKGLRIASVE